MRVKSQILATVLLTGLAVAQTAPASQTVQPKPQPPKPQSQAATSKTAKSPFKPKAKDAHAASPTAKPPVSAKTTAPTTVVVKHAAPVQVKAAPKKKVAPAVQAKATPKPAAPAPAPEKKVEAAPAVAQTAPAKLPNPGKRDPFLSPISNSSARGPGANCTTGKRCLAVDQIVLKGVIQMKNGNFALVENAAKRPYVLHENDSLFNGSVVKITGDSVIFKEESSDILGRPISKEVVKKVSAPAV